MGIEVHPPVFDGSAFDCPHCKAYAKQHWFVVFNYIVGGYAQINEDILKVSRCSHCNRVAFWHNKELLLPKGDAAIDPHEDMPSELVALFEECVAVINISPRSSAALTRLLLQKLVVILGASGKNLNNDIGYLVSKGLPVKIQKALDICRIVGNNAVHPGEINLEDTPEMAFSALKIVNMIVDVYISQPKKIDELYSQMPSGALEAIEKRDSKK